MKVALFMVLVGLACAVDELKWDKIPEAANSSQCIYRIDNGMLSCRGPKELIIECPAVIESSRFSSRKIDVFGISRLPSEEDVKIKTEDMKFALYPRDMDNATYLDNHVRFEGKDFELFLFFDEKKGEESGLRISELKCYERLIELFRSSTMSHEVMVGKENVSLFGEILVADKPAHKRWLGWLWGWGGLGPWGWGMGWGWPFWGMGMWGR